MGLLKFCYKSAASAGLRYDSVGSAGLRYDSVGSTGLRYDSVGSTEITRPRRPRANCTVPADRA